MPRPEKKDDLINAANIQFSELFLLLDSMSEQEQRSDIHPNERDKNVRDILIHLYEWHCLLINWIESNMKGDNVSFLPAPYNWKTYPKMNIEFWKKHQNTSLAEAEKMLKTTHKQVLKVIDNFSDEQLFTKKFFLWTGSTSLGSYCVSSTSSHYDWAIKDIRKALKKYRSK